MQVWYPGEQTKRQLSLCEKPCSGDPAGVARLEESGMGKGGCIPRSTEGVCLLLVIRLAVQKGHELWGITQPRVQPSMTKSILGLPLLEGKAQGSSTP